MSNKIYMSDWEFNAGIVGFLKVMTNNGSYQSLNTIKGVKVFDNYIEVEDSIWNDYFDKLRFYLYKDFFSIDKYVSLFNKMLSYLNGTINDDSIKVYFKRKSYEKLCKEITKSDDLYNESNLKKVIHILANTSLDDLYTIIDGDYFTNISTGYFYGFGIKNITATDKKLTKPCNKCQDRYGEYLFNKSSVSNISGCNYDKINNVWNMNTTVIRVCKCCSYIYKSLLAGLSYNKFRTNTFYFLNHGNTITDIYKYNIDLIDSINNSNILNEIKSITGINNNKLDHINLIRLKKSDLLSSKKVSDYICESFIISDYKLNFLNKHKLYYEIKYENDTTNYTDVLYDGLLNDSLDINILDNIYKGYLKSNVNYNSHLIKPFEFIFDYIKEKNNMQNSKFSSDDLRKRGFYVGKGIYKKLVKAGKSDNAINNESHKILNCIVSNNFDNFMNLCFKLTIGGQCARGNYVLDKSEDWKTYAFSVINGIENKGYNNNNGGTN